MCRSDVDRELNFGKFHKKWGISIHENCLLFASGLAQKNVSNADSINGFTKKDIYAEVHRSLKLKCSFCKQGGASIGCCIGKCNKVYHFPCSRQARCLNQFFGSFRTFCNQHRPKQKILKNEMNGDISCSICLIEVDKSDDLSYIKTYCCQVSFFHRTCMQEYAFSAGYFFKCPLCNSKKKFRQRMRKLGIFMPKRDASWELENGAFLDLLVRPSCGAIKCFCPKGRKENNINSCWELFTCKYCGSNARHANCAKMSSSQTEWSCDSCISFLKLPEEMETVQSETSEKMGTDQSETSDPGPSSSSANTAFQGDNDENLDSFKGYLDTIIAPYSLEDVGLKIMCDHAKLDEALQCTVCEQLIIKQVSRDEEKWSRKVNKFLQLKSMPQPNYDIPHVYSDAVVMFLENSLNVRFIDPDKVENLPLTMWDETLPVEMTCHPPRHHNGDNNIRSEQVENVQLEMTGACTADVPLQEKKSQSESTAKKGTHTINKAVSSVPNQRTKSRTRSQMRHNTIASVQKENAEIEMTGSYIKDDTVASLRVQKAKIRRTRAHTRDNAIACMQEDKEEHFDIEDKTWDCNNETAVASIQEENSQFRVKAETEVYINNFAVFQPLHENQSMLPQTSRLTDNSGKKNQSYHHSVPSSSSMPPVKQELLQNVKDPKPPAFRCSKAAHRTVLCSCSRRQKRKNPTELDSKFKQSSILLYLKNSS